MDLTAKFWNNKYKKNKIGWDLGTISPPLKAYFDQLTNKELIILIPGGGNCYEAEYLFKIGFKNVYVIDLSETAISNIKKRIPNFPKKQLILGDFFDIKLQVDLIIEQTFFCAIHPNLRSSYASKVHEILKDEGKLVGVLFDAKLNDDHPPFGGSKNEYINYFESFYSFKTFTECYNSYTNRQGMELFINLKKK